MSDKVGPVTPLTGLGADAVAWTERRDRTEGTVVAFQAGAATVRVTYAGGDRTGKGIDPAKDPAFTAATQVARSMRMPVRGTPRVVRERPAAPVPAMNDACALVPPEVVRTALGQAPTSHKPDDSLLYHGEGAEDVDGVTAHACSWSATLGPTVDLDAVTISDDIATGGGRAAAVREYRRLYLDGRDAPVRGATFSALRGLGDAAFAYYRPDQATGKGGAGVATVRIGGALLSARCWDTDDYPMDDAVNCAYRSARAAAAKVGR